jgi:hypothetical protein
MLKILKLILISEFRYVTKDIHKVDICPKVQKFGQQVGRWLEEIFQIPIQLNIENTVFNTNTDEFP